MAKDKPYLRTCQECGGEQRDVDPHGLGPKAFETYQDRKCRCCGSDALDYGYLDNEVTRAYTEEDEDLL